MERKKVVALAMALGVAAVCGGMARAQDKKDAGKGPYGLPTLQQVKDKVQPTEDQSKKLEDIYGTAAKNEQESRQRAKENGTDSKTLAGYLTLGRNETINKVKDALDRDKAKAFDELCASQQPSKKK